MIEYNKELPPLYPNPALEYLCFFDASHPLADKKGSVYHHRHVASLKVGHWLSSDEIVHHIDGNRQNNDPDNLEVLTRAEHAHEHKFQTDPETNCICVVCGAPFRLSLSHVKRRVTCSKACMAALYQKRERVSKTDRPSKEELENLVWQMPTVQLAKRFEVSDKAIEKWCKKYGISKPPRGYWMKQK